MKLSDIKATYESFEVGHWIEKIPFPGFDGVRLQVRGLRNTSYQRRFAELAAALPAVGRDNDGMPVAAERAVIVRTCLQDAVLLGWDGLDDAFTPENVAGALADPVLGPALTDAILWAASQVSKQIDAAAGQDAKN